MNENEHKCQNYEIDQKLNQYIIQNEMKKEVKVNTDLMNMNANW